MIVIENDNSPSIRLNGNTSLAERQISLDILTGKKEANWTEFVELGTLISFTLLFHIF